jgi:natural product biosynthesis luciferase-like monooxygenase protein
MDRLSILLIGNETLTQQCGAQILARGHLISAVMTRNALVRSWALATGLRVVGAGDWAALAGLEVEWILSAANLTVIPADILARASRGAVNFHDGPLPRYAGLNAPSWAILNGEAQHGITWHLIEGGVDEGDILEQRLFDIAEDDTVLTLNTRCFEAAMESFPSLLAQLETGLRRQAQDLSKRSTYARAARPPAMGRLDFSQDAVQVARLVRALDHGTYWNPLTTAKIATAAGILNVGSAEMVEASGAQGQVLEAGPEGLLVACTTGALRLTRLTRQSDGAEVSPGSITDPVLPALTGADSLSAALASLAPAEPAIRRALLTLDPVAIPGAVSAETPDWQSLPLSGDLLVLAMAAVRALGLDAGDLAYGTEAGLPGYLSDWAPLRIAGRCDFAQAPASFPLDLMTRDPALKSISPPQLGLSTAGPIMGCVVTLTATELHFDAARLPLQQAQILAARIAHIAEALSQPGAQPVHAPRMTPAEYDQVTKGWNQTLAPRVPDMCLHHAFEKQALRAPDAPALVCEGQSLTYGALNARSNRAAHVLATMGVGPGVLVGLHLRRSLDLVIAALAILKAGGAYVPMDPSYPADRTALFIEDSACPVIVTSSDLTLPAHAAQVLLLDTDPRLASAPIGNPAAGAAPSDLAYMIYTSGSTGRPKGVMVEHRNVVNFFAGMDKTIGTEVGTWLAVTSLSFDISVLELMWTLARGFKVVISSDENRALVASGPMSSAQKIDFSLYYWGNDDVGAANKYELLLEGAKFADSNGFVAVWTPERHFHGFGGAYPNPSVTGAAVAAVTKNIAVRAGSCVAPLHHPVRIAEEWAVVDNLTGGRTGVAFASGWHPDDFILRPENTPPNNRKALFDTTDQVRRLWRGEAVEFPTAAGGKLAVRSQPRPISPELKVWITTAGNPETWRDAGQNGANVLTHLLGQTVDEVAGKIAIYHQALRKAGHNPANFTVTLMLHTYLAEGRETARGVARGPMREYLRSAAGLLKQYAWAFPAFKKPQGMNNPMDIDIAGLAPEEMEAILDFAFDRYFDDSGLFGTIDDAVARVEHLKRIGVGEVACLIDYGITTPQVLAGLEPLAEVLRLCNSGGAPAESDYSIAAQIQRHRVTHLQCTPSMARMLAMNDDAQRALAGVKNLILGGEALPGTLVNDLRAATPARIMNMYGPTETTIWSSAAEVGASEAIQNIGAPLANQQFYVLDADQAPVPPGIPGELWIGGDGVTRGYWQRTDLTAERFRADPFMTPDRACPWGARMYQTGDLVRWRTDGKIDYIGRTDHQVKLRGYRIELGEIEAVLERQPGVTQAVVMAREDSPGDMRLVAYLIGNARETALRTALGAVLPDHMMPSHFVTVDQFALTPNRKIDRKALPNPAMIQPQAESFVAPQSDVESQIAAIWQRVLGVPKVGGRDNFFALGGHSLLAVQVHREIRAALGTSKLSITDIFRFPVLSALARHLDDRPKAAAPTEAPVKADARADTISRRLAMRQRREGQDA